MTTILGGIDKKDNFAFMAGDTGGVVFQCDGNGKIVSRELINEIYKVYPVGKNLLSFSGTDGVIDEILQAIKDLQDPETILQKICEVMEPKRGISRGSGFMVSVNEEGLFRMYHFFGHDGFINLDEIPDEADYDKYIIPYTYTERREEEQAHDIHCNYQPGGIEEADKWIYPSIKGLPPESITPLNYAIIIIHSLNKVDPGISNGEIDFWTLSRTGETSRTICKQGKEKESESNV